jgi:hypothetical protein
MITLHEESLQQRSSVIKHTPSAIERLGVLLWAVTEVDVEPTLDLDGLVCYEIPLSILPPAIAADVAEIVFAPDMPESIGRAFCAYEVLAVPAQWLEVAA